MANNCKNLNAFALAITIMSLKEINHNANKGNIGKKMDWHKEKGGKSGRKDCKFPNQYKIMQILKKKNVNAWF